VSTLFLADTSAFTIATRSPQAENRLRQLAVDATLATFVTIDLEMGYSARNPSQHQGITRIRAQLVQFPCIDEIAIRAREVQALMAARSQHRAAGVIDLLTAAAAEHYGATLLHYDADFDHIAAVTTQPTEWITPQGSTP
jgi:predicted nucleic acid-binding protein